MKTRLDQKIEEFMSDRSWRRYRAQYDLPYAFEAGFRCAQQMAIQQWEDLAGKFDDTRDLIDCLDKLVEAKNESL